MRFGSSRRVLRALAAGATCLAITVVGPAAVAGVPRAHATAAVDAWRVSSAVGFARDIRPLFTDMDVAHMRPLGVLLDDYTYMSDPAHAQDVLDSVSSGSMPPPDSGEPPWSPDKVQLFRDWIDGGYQP